MRQKIKKYIPYLVIGICLVWIVASFFSRNPHIKTIHTTDTIFVTEWETLRVYKPLFLTKKVIDTLRIYINDTTKVELPIEEKYYSEPDKYEAWVSGVNPNLDRINIFNKTEYKTVTNTTTNIIYKTPWRGYIGGQIQAFDDKIIPSINILLVTPKSVAFGAGIGVFENKPVYQFNFNYKLFGK